MRLVKRNPKRVQQEERELEHKENTVNHRSEWDASISNFASWRI